ncbi:MAG: bifunctional oligoribonuclease/PAP phosphatase NrnA [Eubacterium sp.]|nr:bifunctional oligoribonuclease/PAP phosphatase NrnA [Eubacterium sp.]
MKRIDDFLDGVTCVGISGHVRPDGDCIGSVLGCYNYIAQNYPEIDVHVYLDNIVECFEFLPASEKIEKHREYKAPFDLFISLDCADRERLGDSVKLFKAAKNTVCIDHHVSNKGFADENFIEPNRSSASELLYTMLDPDKVTEEVAVCLYTGIVHDTGVFQYSCTGRETMSIAGRLIEFGFDFPRIIEESFFAKSYAQNKATGLVVCGSSLHAGGKVIVGTLTFKQMKEVGVDVSHLDGIVNQLKVTEGVHVAVFVHQNSDGWKVSMRSDGVNVSDVAVSFGGGGHVRAAGCTLREMTLEEAVDTILVPVIKAVEEDYPD